MICGSTFTNQTTDNPQRRRKNSIPTATVEPQTPLFLSSEQSGIDTCYQSTRRSIRKDHSCNCNCLVRNIRVLPRLHRLQGYPRQMDIPSESNRDHGIHHRTCIQSVSRHPMAQCTWLPVPTQGNSTISKFHVQSNHSDIVCVRMPFHRSFQSINILQSHAYTFPCQNIRF